VAAVCRSVILLEAGKPDSAQRQSERFFAAGTHVAPAGLLLVDELDRRSRPVPLAKTLRRLVEMAPDEPILQARWGGVCLARGDTVLAAQCAEEVARRRGDFVAATRRLIRAYGRWERWADAIVLLYRLAPRVDTPSEYAAVQRDLGFAALGVGDTLQARLSWEEAQTWRPSREVRDALAFLRVLRDLPPEEAARRAGARAEHALGWNLGPSPQIVRRLEELRVNRESCRVRALRSAEWRRGEW
jgi:predicted Zn-dependent protease